MQKDNQKRRKLLNSYLKYSSLAFQMGGTIAFMAWVGIKIDEWQQTPQPYYTIAFCLLGVFLSLYLVISGLIKKTKDK